MGIKETQAFNRVAMHSQHLQKKAFKQQQQKFNHPNTLVALLPIALIILLVSVMVSLKPETTGNIVFNDQKEFPKYIHPTQEFVVPKGQEWVIDMDTLFFHPDKLTYTITTTDKISFQIHNNLLTITPENNFVGERFISILASAGKTSTRVALKFKVDDDGIIPAISTDELPVTTSLASQKTQNLFESPLNGITGSTIADITGAIVTMSSCMQITTPDIYTLTQDIHANTNCIEILTGGVTLDCLNHKIQGSGTNVGILLNLLPRIQYQTQVL